MTDIKVTSEFYTSRLGFEIKLRWEPDGRLRWCWAERDGVAIMLQEFSEDPAQRPSGKLGAGITISFQCRDALALYREFRRHGVECDRPFVGNANWVFSVSDPDGYRLEFESPTDSPEGTEYANGFSTESETP